MFYAKVWRVFLSQAQICLKCSNASPFKLIKRFYKWLYLENVIMPNSYQSRLRNKFVLTSDALFFLKLIVVSIYNLPHYLAPYSQSYYIQRLKVPFSFHCCHQITRLGLRRWQSRPNWFRWSFLCYLCPIRVMYRYSAIEIKQGLAPSAK